MLELGRKGVNCIAWQGYYRQPVIPLKEAGYSSNPGEGTEAKTEAIGCSGGPRFNREQSQKENSRSSKRSSFQTASKTRTNKAKERKNMTTQKFSKKEAIRFGWNTMKSNLGFFIVLLIVWVLLYSVPFIIAEMVLRVNIFLGNVLFIADFALTIIISIGLVKIALRFCDNDKGRFTDLFSQYRLFFKYLFGLILYSLIVLGGTLLLIIPGIIWGIKFWFFDYFIVDKKLGPIEALKGSSAITRGVKWDLFVFFLLLLGINLLGALSLLIGLFATIPTTMVAWAFVYRKLLAQTEAAETIEIPKPKEA
jgi:uncharacterized membrane protein